MPVMGNIHTFKSLISAKLLSFLSLFFHNFGSASRHTLSKNCHFVDPSLSLETVARTLTYA